MSAIIKSSSAIRTFGMLSFASRRMPRQEGDCSTRFNWAHATDIRLIKARMLISPMVQTVRGQITAKPTQLRSTHRDVPLPFG